MVGTYTMADTCVLHLSAFWGLQSARVFQMEHDLNCYRYILPGIYSKYDREFRKGAMLSPLRPVDYQWLGRAWTIRSMSPRAHSIHGAKPPRAPHNSIYSSMLQYKSTSRRGGETLPGGGGYSRALYNIFCRRRLWQCFASAGVGYEPQGRQWKP